jgi:hypothetical protein
MRGCGVPVSAVAGRLMARDQMRLPCQSASDRRIVLNASKEITVILATYSLAGLFLHHQPANVQPKRTGRMPAAAWRVVLLHGGARFRVASHLSGLQRPPYHALLSKWLRLRSGNAPHRVNTSGNSRVKHEQSSLKGEQQPRLPKTLRATRDRLASSPFQQLQRQPGGRPTTSAPVVAAAKRPPPAPPAHGDERT